MSCENGRESELWAYGFVCALPLLLFVKDGTGRDGPVDKRGSLAKRVQSMSQVNIFQFFNFLLMLQMY